VSVISHHILCINNYTCFIVLVVLLSLVSVFVIQLEILISIYSLFIAFQIALLGVDMGFSFIGCIWMELVNGRESDFYVLCSFIKAKSDVSLEDVRTLIQTGLELFHMSRNKLYAQVLHFFLDEIWSFLVFMSFHALK